MKKVISQANEERKNGYKISINVMKKNKKFQKELLAKDGYEEIREFFCRLELYIRKECKKMAESMKGLRRTCRCAELTKENVGQTVTVMGWVQKKQK